VNGPAGLSDAELALSPSPEEFAARAASQPIVPISCEIVADTLTPVAAFLHAVGERPGFLLESVEGGERWGRYSFVGRSPLATISARDRQVVSIGRLAVPTREGVLATLEAVLKAYHQPVLPELPPLYSGVVGYLGYDVVREIERLPDVPPDDEGFPDAVLAVIGQVAAFDHWRQRVVLVDNVVVGEDRSAAGLSAAYESARARLAEFARDIFGPTDAAPVPIPSPRPGARAEATRTMTSEQYRSAVAVAKGLIEAGDIFQVVLSQRYDLVLEAAPFEVYRALRLLNPSPYLYFLRFDEVTVVGSSPEPMVRLRDDVVISRPIAGSRPRGPSEHEDDFLAGQLSEDPKERAEHVMLVDLARNDVGRVGNFGTVVVDEFMTIERYSHVMHLTSQVSGTLRDGLGPIDVLRATLPAGTLSGAPKVRAMEIIDELEPTKRGVYGGVVGYLDFSGNLDTAIAIRTLVVAPDGHGYVQAGAGIVADSDPKSEDSECADKAAALLFAVAAARAMGAARAGTVRQPASVAG
jgi:anthranilate synthase component 1